jgi:hypothetical protein
MFAHGPHDLRTPEENMRDGLVTEAAIKKYQQQLMYAERVGNASFPLSTTAPAAHCNCPSCIPRNSSIYTHDPYVSSSYTASPMPGYEPYDYYSNGSISSHSECQCAECTSYYYASSNLAAPASYLP